MLQSGYEDYNIAYEENLSKIVNRKQDYESIFLGMLKTDTR